MSQLLQFDNFAIFSDSIESVTKECKTYIVIRAKSGKVYPVEYPSQAQRNEVYEEIITQLSGNL